jgi:hypothetical protein
MAKAFYNYQTNGLNFAFLQDTASAAAMGNTPAAVNTPRLPHKLKPRKLAIKVGAGVYKHLVAETDLYGGHTFGDTVLGGVVVGFDGEVNNAFSAF